MTTNLIDAPTAVPAGSCHAEVLGILQAVDRPISAAAVAEASGLHLTTTRFHLDALVGEALAQEPRTVPARPRILDTARGPMPGPRSFGLLGETLTGFTPETRVTSKGTEIRLHHRPCREVAQTHADSICGLHHGLMQGALGELRAPLDATSLEPFVTPQLCLAHLQTMKAT